MSTITLRVPDDLKQRLQAMAESRGESLNHFIESIAVQALVAEETARRIQMRRGRGSAAKALAVLDRVADRPAQKDDRRPSAAAGEPRKRRRVVDPGGRPRRDVPAA